MRAAQEDFPVAPPSTRTFPGEDQSLAQPQLVTLTAPSVDFLQQ